MEDANHHWSPIAHDSSKGRPACGRDGMLCQRGYRSHPPFDLDPTQVVGHLGCGLGLLVQCPSPVPLTQGGSGLGAEILGCTASVGLVVSNVIESPKPRSKIISSWRREGEIIMVLWAPPYCLSPLLRHRKLGLAEGAPFSVSGHPEGGCAPSPRSSSGSKSSIRNSTSSCVSPMCGLQISSSVRAGKKASAPRGSKEDRGQVVSVCGSTYTHFASGPQA